MKAIELADYFDRLLNVYAIQDDSLNGLQVENTNQIQLVAFAVDVSLQSIQKAREMGAQFLFVHHGLFWGKPIAITGSAYKRLKLLIDSEIALYAAHLPLDLHPQFGNNVQIAKLLELKNAVDFGEYHGNIIGKEIRLKKPIELHELADRFRSKFHCNPTVWNFGSQKVKRLAIISGGAVSMIDQVVRCGIDTFLTGEPAHSYYWLAKESNINVIFGGHYLTETSGIKAIENNVKKNKKINTVFLDFPTGL